MAGQMPKETHQNIMHSSVTKGNLLLQGADMMAPGETIRGNTLSLAVDCGSEDEINSLFSKLSAGGTITMPLHAEFWGATFGMLVDKYGYSWMLNYQKPS